jgi:hypothetical protein
MPMFLILLLSGVAGCRETTDTVSDVAGSSKLALMPKAGLADASLSKQSGGGSDSPPIIDAGIIFADRSNYLCVPIERLGVHPSAEIVSVSTSCECVQAKMVSYSIDSVKQLRAILFEFNSDSPVNEAKNQSTNHLRIEVTLLLADSSSHRRKLQFLELTGFRNPIGDEYR